MFPTPKKAAAKFKRLIGDKMYADVMALHEADIKAKDGTCGGNENEVLHMRQRSPKGKPMSIQQGVRLCVRELL